MPDRVSDWLRQLGLDCYAASFAGNDIEVHMLGELTDADLKELGIASLGHRKKILNASAQLANRKELGAEGGGSHAAWERLPGERKPVTLLFADITGSTALTEKLDAEETHDLLYGATERMCAAVENYRGTVCRFMGDGVMAMFGAPTASEHHAVAACEAALMMQDSVMGYARQLEAAGGASLRIRVGLHSGEVVVSSVGEGERLEYDASGPAVPIAARMEQIAEPGKIYITAATRGLAAERITVETLCPVRVKGISQPLPVFSLSGVRSIEEAAETARDSSVLVGRQAELAQFNALLQNCLDSGQGQLLYIRGEPGIGKTRLAAEFARIAARQGLAGHRCQALAFGAGKGQDPIRALVRSLLAITPGSGKDQRREAAAGAISEGLLDAGQQVYLNDLLDLAQPIELRSLYDAMDNDTRNQGKQLLIRRLIRRSARRQALLLTLEDVHNAEPIVLDYLGHLVRAVAACPAVLVMTSRLDGDPLDRGWRGSLQGVSLTTIDLSPLRREEAIQLIGEFMESGNPLAEGCLERAAGNPLFLEQLVHNSQEGLVDSLPDSIQSLVLARLDRLADRDKQALQAAAVIGLQFSLTGLRQVLKRPDYDCAQLVEHNLIRVEGSAYAFSHALIQEGVYGSLLKRHRRSLHGHAAEFFKDQDLGLHAEHLALAGDRNAARAFLHAAREQAAHYRFQRALDLAERGLALAGDANERHALMCLKGTLTHDMGDTQTSINTYEQALEAATDDIQRCDAWLGIAAGMRVIGDYAEGLKLLDKAQSPAVEHRLIPQLSRLHHLRGNLYFMLVNPDCAAEHETALGYARQGGLIEDQARALGGLGDAIYAQGRILSSHDKFEQCLQLCRENGFGRIEAAYRIMRMIIRMYSEPIDEVMPECREVADLAVRVGHRRAEMAARVGACTLLLDSGRPHKVQAEAERGLALGRELGARIWEASFLLWMGLAQHGDNDRRALELIHRAAVITREFGTTLNGGRVFGALALTADTRQLRDSALAEGQAALHDGAISHNYIWFYRFAMETMIETRQWSRVEDYASALERYTRGEPLRWANFFIDRGRALAALGQGHNDAALRTELQRVAVEAKFLNLRIALPAIEAALAKATLS